MNTEQEEFVPNYRAKHDLAYRVNRDYSMHRYFKPKTQDTENLLLSVLQSEN